MDGERREVLVAAAGEALWYYVIQREVCGLRDGETVMRQLGVPREVRLRMGFVPRRAQAGGAAESPACPELVEKPRGRG